jgi:hypothetical protein
VAFSGGSSGIAELIWGQRDAWEIIRYLNSDDQRINLVLDAEVPESSASVDPIVRALQILFMRYESLRTCFPVSACGEPFQKLLPDGEIHVQGWSAEKPVSREMVECLRGLLVSERFDIVSGPLVRLTTLADKRPRHIIMSMPTCWRMANRSRY